MPFALLLTLKLVLKLLLKFLFGEVHFTNSSVIFYPPLTSWRKGINFTNDQYDSQVLPLLNTRYYKKKKKASNDASTKHSFQSFWKLFDQVQKHKVKEHIREAAEQPWGLPL